MMRVFVTGATGFIGFAIVKELIAAGHQVTGLARSAASGTKLVRAGAKVQLGTIEDLDGLHRAASGSDGVIHTAFYHKLSHMPLSTRLHIFFGGTPGGIVQRFLAAAVDSDRRAIEAMGRALSGFDRPLVATFGTLALRPGQLATEDQPFDPSSFGAARSVTENTLQSIASHGVRTSAIRLPPTVHGPGDRGGLTAQLIKTARSKKESAYVGDGKNRWPSVHRDDAARLFRLALENGNPGSTWHGVAEEGIPFREIADFIGRRLNVPTVSKSADKAAKHFGFLAPFVPVDNPTSSELTRERLGWRPAHTGLFDDLEREDYFPAGTS